MNQLRFYCMLFYTAMVFFLTACGTGEQKTTTDTTGTDSDTTATTPAAPAASSVVTTPQDMMVARHRVSDFAKWKASYEEHDSMRLANGLHNYVIGRGVNDSNTILVAVKADDMAKAKAFANDRSLKQAMQKGGVLGTPTFNFITMVFQDTARIGSDIRSLTLFRVKDWDAWKASFESNRQLRTDNGLMDRAYGYEAGDNHKVRLVVAVTDTARANTFWNSDQLKQKRKEGGVEGTPERFVFRVVQRY